MHISSPRMLTQRPRERLDAVGRRNLRVQVGIALVAELLIFPPLLNGLCSHESIRQQKQMPSYWVAGGD